MRKADVELLSRYVNGQRITSDEMNEVWLKVSQHVANVARRHYQSVQRRGFQYKVGGTQKVISKPLHLRVTDNKAYDKTMMRLSLFFDFILENSDKTIPWLIFAYRRRFALFEFILDCRLSGIGLYSDLTLTQQVTHIHTKKIVECQSLLRQYELDPTDTLSLRRIYESTTTKRKRTIDEYIRVYSSYIQSRFPHLFPETWGYSSGETTEGD